MSRGSAHGKFPKTGEKVGSAHAVGCFLYFLRGGRSRPPRPRFPPYPPSTELAIGRLKGPQGIQLSKGAPLGTSQVKMPAAYVEISFAETREEEVRQASLVTRKNGMRVRNYHIN